MRYTKKQPDNSVEAVQWDGTAEGAEMVINNIGKGRLAIDHTRAERYIVLEISATETLKLEKGDWLVLHQEGPPSVMDNKTFRQNYENGPPVLIPTNWPAAQTAQRRAPYFFWVGNRSFTA